MLTATLLLSTAVNASNLPDGGLELGLRSAQAQQDKGKDEYLDGRLQEFVETKQNGRDYDPAQVEGYNSPLADQMDEFAGMEQESDDGSDKEENMADLEQDSKEGGTDHDLSNKQQNDGNSYNEAELEQDEVDNDGKVDSLPQQMNDGGEEEKLDSLLQQTGDGEDGGNMEQDAINQQIGDGNDENNEKLEVIFQQMDNDVEAIVAQYSEDGTKQEDETAMAQWNNKLKGPLRVKCSAGYGLYYVYSLFNKGKMDRVFRWYCKKVSYIIMCIGITCIYNNYYFTPFENGIDLRLIYL